MSDEQAKAAAECAVCGGSHSEESEAALGNVLLVAAGLGAMLLPEDGEDAIVLGRAEMGALGALRAATELAGGEFARVLGCRIRRAAENEIASLGGVEGLRTGEGS